ncbi:DUF7305 domain-containing protein [Haliangium sp.]|uniref:DUF7305 domain-containing protein n=1 Tax=Haliangium sp. TaxID=2663208 RepID=UPI003D14D5B4
MTAHAPTGRLPRAAPAWLLGAALAASACTTTDVIAVLGDAGPSSGRADYCPEPGPPVRGDGGDTCPAELIASLFPRALCACAEITTDDTLTVDGFDSLDGPYAPGGPGGSVATNGKLQANGEVRVGEDLTVAGAEGAALATALTVGRDLASAGALSGPNAVVTVAGDAAVGGDVDLAELTVDGTMTLVDGAVLDVAAGERVTTLVRAPVDVAPACACADADLLDVVGLVEHQRLDNDNQDIGLDPAALANFGPDTTLELPCGRFFLDRVQSDTGSLTLSVTGRAALYIAEGITLGRSWTIALGPDAELDLFIANPVNVAGDLVLGDPAAPRRLRIYVGAGGSINLSGRSVLGANLYAPTVTLSLPADAELYGALFVDRLATSGPLEIHHDRAVLAPAACP